MPALLTAVVITCAAIKGPDQPKVCTANVYHGAYTEPFACRQTAIEMARYFEQAIVNDGRLTNTNSYGECTPAADDVAIVSYLPIFVREQFGAVNIGITHFDLVDGKAIERAKAKKAVKGLRT